MRLKFYIMGEKWFPAGSYCWRDEDNPCAGLVYARKVDGAFFICELNELANASSIGRYAPDEATARRFAGEILSARRSERVAESSPQLSLFQETAL